jgi:hypothetical protein
MLTIADIVLLLTVITFGLGHHKHRPSYIRRRAVHAELSICACWHLQPLDASKFFINFHDPVIAVIAETSPKSRGTATVIEALLCSSRSLKPTCFIVRTYEAEDME